MKIEEAIQQRRFKHEYEKLAVNISYTQSVLQGKLHELLKPRGLTVQQFNILRILRGQHPAAASVNMLIERMVDRASNASRIVDKLESKGLVVRKTCPLDRRQMDVTITQPGLDVLKELDSELEVFYKTFSTLSEKEAQILNELLDKLRKDII